MESKGCIFNIQKFSTNDGPGIRTTVFLRVARCTAAGVPIPNHKLRSRKFFGIYQNVYVANNVFRHAHRAPSNFIRKRIVSILILNAASVVALVWLSVPRKLSPWRGNGKASTR